MASGASGALGFGDVVGLSSTSLLDIADSGDQAGGTVMLSTDSGRTFHHVLDLPGSPAGSSGGALGQSQAYLGSQDADHARIVVQGVSRIFSTADGGKTWSSHVFS